MSPERESSRMSGAQLALTTIPPTSTFVEDRPPPAPAWRQITTRGTDMHERKTLRRLGVIVGAGLVTVGLAAFPAYTGADNGGNGNGNGNGNGHGNGNGNSADDDDENGNGNGGVDHVVICHVPPGNPDNEHTIIVGEPAVDAHVDNHGDSMGPCEAATSTTTSTSSTTIPPTTSTSTTTTSTTTTTSSTTTSTTTTSPGVAPVAVFDIAPATVGVAVVPLDVLANDDLGTPLATIVQPVQVFFDPVGACSGLSIDPVTGLLTGTPTQLGPCVFAYEIENTAGSDTTAVFVVVSP
jgi:hypothetical protein